MPIEGQPKEIPAQVFDKYFLSNFIISSTPSGSTRVIIEVAPYRVEEVNGAEKEIYAQVQPIKLIIQDLFRDTDITEDPVVGMAILETQAKIFDAVGKVLVKKGLI